MTSRLIAQPLHQPRACWRAAADAGGSPVCARAVLNVIAPSKARRLLSGESPGRVRAATHPYRVLVLLRSGVSCEQMCRASVHRESCRP